MNTGMPDFRNLAEEAKDRIASVLPRSFKSSKFFGAFSSHPGSKAGNSRESSGKRGLGAVKAKLFAGGRGLKAKASRQINVPVILQTALAVVICCGVLIAAGFGIYTVEQLEIHELRADLKAYSQDGVMPATYMNTALSLNVEAIAGRVTALTAVVGDGTGIDTEALQEINLQLIEIEGEAEALNRLIANLHPEETVEKSFSENVQNPLYDLETTVENLILNNEEFAEASAQNGAANDTGAFKVGKSRKQLPLRIVIIFGAAVVIGVFLFLFRKKLFGLFSRGEKPEGKKQSSAGAAKKTGPRQKTGNRDGYRQRRGNPPPAGREPAAKGRVPADRTAASTSPAVPPEQRDPDVTAADIGERSEKTTATPVATATATTAPMPEFADDDPIAKLAPALQKLAVAEREKAAAAKEGSMNYDETISSLAEIATAEADDLFAAADDDELN